MKTIAALSTAVLAAFVIFVGSAMAQGKLEKTNVVVGLPVTTSTLLPIYLARNEGFFKQAGLDVKFVTFRGGTDMVRAMIAGSVDVGLGSLAVVTVGIQADQPIKAFYGGFNMTLFDWYAVKGIDKLEDAKGKRFGITRFGTATDFLTRYALTTKGLDPAKDVRIIQGGGSQERLAAMDAGQIDVNIFATPEKFVAADAGYKLIFRQQDIAPDFPFHMFFASEDFIKHNPNTVKAFLSAFIKAVRVAKADRERSIKVLVDEVKLEPKYAARAYDDFIADIYEDGRLPSDTGMKAFWDMGIASGDYTEAWPKERYLVPTFIDTYNEWKPAQ